MNVDKSKIIDAEIVEDENTDGGIIETAESFADFFDAVSAPLEKLHIKHDKLKMASHAVRGVAKDARVVREKGAKAIAGAERAIVQGERVLEKGKVFIDAVKNTVVKVKPRDIPER